MKFNFAIFALAGAVAVVAQSTASNNGTTSATGSSSSVESSTSAASSTGAASSSTDASSSSAASSTSAADSTSAVAQDTASAAAPYPTSSSGSSGSTFQVPSGISDSCSTFLQNLDQAKEVQACVSPALDALQGANPTIDNVCAKVASSTCSETAYYNFLTYFTSNCTNELITSPNADVNAIFDSLYVALPFQKAVCTKDTITGKWCAQRGSNSTAGSPGVSNAAQTPLSDSKGYPDASAFSSNNILFLGYSADQDQSTLCTSCLQKILAIFFGHEGKRPYPSGLQNSPLVSVQNPLFAAVKQKCPADFVSGAISNVVPDPASVNAASAFTPAKGVAVLFALVAGVIAL